MKDQSHRRADPPPTAAVTTCTNAEKAEAEPVPDDAVQTETQSPTADLGPANSDEEA